MVINLSLFFFKDIFGDDEEFQEDASTTEIEDIEDDEYTNFDEIDGNDEKGDETDILYNEDGYESEYDEEYEEDDDYAPENGNKKGSSKIGLLIFLFIVILGLAGGAFWFFKMNGNNILNNQINKEQTEAQNVELPQTEQQPQENQTPQNNEQPEDMFGTGIDITQTEQPQNESQESGSIDVPPLTENDLLPPTVPTIQEEKQNTNVANVMASAFTNGNVPITLRGINWLCNQSLYTDGEFKGYLQRLDNTLKLNIRKNILDITETPQNSSVTVKLAVDNNGNVLRTMISSSSGSQQIDNIVLQSINETFATEKSVILNNSAQKADKYFIQVVIKL